MKRIVAFILMVVLVFCFAGCQTEEKFKTPGYDVLYDYLSNRAPDEQLHFENNSYKYFHDYVAIEARKDMLCIFVDLPVENSIFHDIICVRLKNNEKKADVSVSFHDDKKAPLYGYIDLTTYSVELDVIWGVETRELGEIYGKYLADGLLFVEYYIQNQFDVSLKDLGFVNF